MQFRVERKAQYLWVDVFYSSDNYTCIARMCLRLLNGSLFCDNTFHLYYDIGRLEVLP